MTTDDTSMPAGIDRSAVTRWIAESVGQAEPPFRFKVIAGGKSNLTFRVEDANGYMMAMRRPPLGHILESAHDMGREFRVISAMGQTGVPVPEALALCTDREVNGADFYVMSFVEGLVPHDAAAAKLIPEPERRPLSCDVVEVLAALHSLDPDEIGLGDFGRREDYVARQLRRWSRQWDQSKQREIPEMERVVEILTSRVPDQARSTVVHGDFRLGNMVVGAGRVLALLDWELCTLGDPLADVGYLANAWLDSDEPPTWREAPTQAKGFATRAEVLAQYGELTGADLSGIGYYQAFQQWRMAAILEGVYARYRHGAMGDNPSVELNDLADSVVHLAREALAEAER